MSEGVKQYVCRERENLIIIINIFIIIIIMK